MKIPFPFSGTGMGVENSIPDFRDGNWRPVFPGIPGIGNSRSWLFTTLFLKVSCCLLTLFMKSIHQTDTKGSNTPGELLLAEDCSYCSSSVWQQQRSRRQSMQGRKAFHYLHSRSTALLVNVHWQKKTLCFLAPFLMIQVVSTHVTGRSQYFPVTRRN